MRQLRKTVTRLLFATGFMLLTFNFVSAQSQLKIGYTNPELIISQMPQFRAVQDSLQNLAQLSQIEIDVKVEEFQTKVADYQEKAALLPETTRASREAE